MGVLVSFAYAKEILKASSVMSHSKNGGKPHPIFYSVCSGEISVKETQMSGVTFPKIIIYNYGIIEDPMGYERFSL